MENMTTVKNLTDRDKLEHWVSGDDPAALLWGAVQDGSMQEVAPEILDLDMEQHPTNKHKDVLAHTFIVVGKAPDDLVVRLAALFHDVGKPATRKFENGDVTFYNHEAVGAGMTKRRLRQLGFPAQIVHDVTELVRLSGRFKGYDAGWSDSAVRRYAREAGELLPKLNQLVRSDCTTRHKWKEDNLHKMVDDLEHRLEGLAEAERLASERPQIDGGQVMSYLGLSPGPDVGRVMKWLLALKREEGELPEDELHRRLDAWWSEQEVSTAA